MTMGVGPRKEKVLDGDEVNRLWLELGTLNKVVDSLVKRGVISPRTGKPISKAAIAMSNWRWCLKNPETSFDRVYKSRAARGEYITKKEWFDELIIHARTALTPMGYSKFLKKYDLEEQAKSVR